MFLCRKVVGFFLLNSQDHITSTKGERKGESPTNLNILHTVLACV